MGLITNRIKRRKLELGDHIYSYRLHSYSHHGIYTEENRVIHFTRTQEQHDIGESSNNPGGCGCSVCGYDAAQHRGVVKTCLDCFLKGHSLYRFEYNVSQEHLLLKRSGTCSTMPHDGPHEAIRRATEMLLSGGAAFGEYHLMDNNCETFARYCMTGRRVSLQAVSKRAQAKIAYKAIISKPFSVTNVCEAIWQIAVGHRLDMLAFDEREHGEDKEDEDDEYYSADEDGD